MKRIGSIYACIAGDYRYGTTIEVRGDAQRIEVRNISRNPVGGMDGPGGTTDDSEVLRTWDLSDRGPEPLLNAQVARDIGKELLTYLKRAFKEVDGGTVAEYGKPTKRFTWYMGDGGKPCGFNIALAEEAIKFAASSAVPA